MNFDVIVLGSGPGGYVTAIRASQLGLKTAIIEKENLGGVCLNWGCIPTKALLKSAQVFEYINHADDFGITVEKPKANFPSVIKRSRDVADGMSKGVEYLMKKNKIEVINGHGKVSSGNSVTVNIDNKETKYTAKHIIIATGARSRELPNLKQDGKKVIGYREALSLSSAPKKMVIVGSATLSEMLQMHLLVDHYLLSLSLKSYARQDNLCCLLLMDEVKPLDLPLTLV